MLARKERGESLVEFAISALLLLLILAGVIDLGRGFHAYVVVTNAAREGAYYGAMHPDDPDGILARVTNEAQGSGVTVEVGDINIISPSTDHGMPMVVTVDHDFSLLTAGIIMGGRVLHIQGRAEMVIY